MGAVTSFSQEDVVATTRKWLGTPYHHQASRRAVGADCLGLVRGVYADIRGQPAEEPPPYNPSWAEISFREDLLGAAHRHLNLRWSLSDGRKATAGDYQVGDVLVFKMFPKSASKHCGIVVSPSSMIHAYDPHGTVETTLDQNWLQKISAVFSFPFVRR
jgi:NlpC/P60 family putative phage cell wall peptidase